MFRSPKEERTEKVVLLPEDKASSKTSGLIGRAFGAMSISSFGLFLREIQFFLAEASNDASDLAFKFVRRAPLILGYFSIISGEGASPWSDKSTNSAVMLIRLPFLEDCRYLM